MSRGIDYAPRGSLVNRDSETGIRYGILPVSAIDSEWFWDSVEPEYDPACPECGADLPEDFDEGACPECDEDIRDGAQYGDEPSRNVLSDADVDGIVDESNDVWIFKSPYYTHAAFCSPCAPGACYLASPCEDGERAYCLGHDWFGDDGAPYPVFSVATGELVSRPRMQETYNALREQGFMTKGDR